MLSVEEGWCSATYRVHMYQMFLLHIAMYLYLLKKPEWLLIISLKQM